MKKFILAFAVLAFTFSLCSAQATNWWKPGSNHKILIGTGHNARINVVDTGKPNQSIISNGNADPTWKSVLMPVRLSKDTLTTSTAGVYTDLQFNASDTQSYYWFRIDGFDTSSSSAGIKFLDSIPSGATIKAAVRGQSTGITAQTSDLISANATLSIAFATATSTNNGWFTVVGTMHTASTAGKCFFGVAKGTSGTGGILAGSTLLWGKF